MNMADQESERFNPELNVGARQADERFRFDPTALRRAEQQGTESDEQYDNADEARDQEHQPRDKADSFSFKDKNDQAEGGKRSGRLGGMFKMRHMLQKGGPAAFIAGALIGGGLIANTFMAPAMLVNHMAERLTERFNVQEVTNSVRSPKLSVLKYSSSKHIGSYTGNLLEEGKRTFGFSKKKHRFASVSKAQIERFKQNGIHIETENGILNRKRIKSVTIEDPSLGKGGKVTYDTPDALRTAVDNNPIIADKIQTAGRGRWGLMFDKVTAKVKSKLGILFKPLSAKVKPDADADGKPKTGTPDDPNAKSQTDTDANSKRALEQAQNDAVNKGTTPDADSMKGAVSNAGETLNDAVDDISDSKKTGHKSNAAASKLMSALGHVTDACVFYQVASRAVHIAKTLHALQLARYAGTFLTMASALKAGDATEEQISYFANRMTATTPITRDVNGSRVITGYEPTAMDSQGFYYTMTGLMGEPNESTRKYQMGVNDPGAIRTFLDVRNKIDQFAFGGFNLTQFCNVMASPFMSLVQGAIALLSCLGLGCAGVVGSIAWSVGQSAIYASAQKWLGDSIQRTLGGNAANSKTQGEDMGNALTAGTGYFLGKTANAGGHMPMTKELALGFLEERDRYIAKQAEIIRATHSPFDTSTRHTMMGSIVSGFMPYMARMRSFTGRIGSLLSYAKSSVLPSMMPRVSALSDADKLAARKATLDICSDPEYRIFGKSGADNDIDIHSGQKVAQRTNNANKEKYYAEGNSVGIDPFCNWIFGIPSQQLHNSEYDPLHVLEFFAPGTFQRDDKGKLIPKLVDYGMTCKDNKEFKPPTIDKDKNVIEASGATCFDSKGEPDKIVEKMESYISGVMSKGYLMPVNANGPCSFRPILSKDRKQVLMEPWAGDYTQAQLNNPCFSWETPEGEQPGRDPSYYGYQFWWQIDDREDQCRYRVKSEYHPGAHGSGHYSIKEEEECPARYTQICNKNGECKCIAPLKERCLPKNRKKPARSEYYIKAVKTNPLSRFKYNCIDRGDVPFGKEELLDEADPKEKKDQVKEDRELEGETVAERNFGGKQGYVLNKGEECILNGSKERTMFALYFMDERIQCMLDGNEDCDNNAMVSDRFGSPD